MFPFCGCNPLFFLRRVRGLSLHHGAVWLRRSGWIKIGEAESTEHASRTLGRFGDRSFGGAVAETKLDHANALEGGQCFGRREIEACRF